MTIEKWYHGSSSNLMGNDGNFNYDVDRESVTGKEYGPGAYLTNTPDDASGYGAKVHIFHSTEEAPILKNPMPERKKLTARQIHTLITSSPHFKERIQNFKSDDRTSDDVAAIRHANFLHGMQKMYDQGSTASSAAHDTINSIYSDFWGHEHTSQFLSKVVELTGHDGVVRKFDNGVTHVIHWEPHKLKVQRVHDTFTGPLNEDEAPTTTTGVLPTTQGSDGSIVADPAVRPQIFNPPNMPFGKWKHQKKMSFSEFNKGNQQ